MQRARLCPVSKKVSEGMDLQSLRQLIKSHWHLSTLEVLKSLGSSNFNKLYDISGLNPKTLTSVLKDLVGMGLVERKVVSQHPLAVSYSITEKGISVVSLDCPFITSGI